MSSKSGAFTVKKGFRKAKPGYDQEFTLQKGVSAAPIKQATSYKPKIRVSKKRIADAGIAVGTGIAIGTIATKKSKRPKGGWTPGD